MIRVRESYTSRKFAAKRMFVDDMDEVQNELHVLSTLHHGNVIKAHELLLDMYHNLPCAALVLELAEGFNLHEWYTDRGAAATIAQVRLFIRQLTSAVDHIHSRGFMHRDLKPANVMLSDLSQSGVIKLVDFGLARVITTDDERSITICGTREYNAPEMIACDRRLRSSYGKEVDMWGVGLITFFLLFGHNPFSRSTQTQEDTADAILNGQYAMPAASLTGEPITESISTFLGRLLDVDESTREDAAGALSSAWLSDSVRRRTHLGAWLPVWFNRVWRRGLPAPNQER